MSISQHILEYTLQNRFGGNHSEFAREIGVEPSDLRRAMRTVKQGGNSAKTLDLTLELYAHDRSAWDVLLHEYLPSPDSLPPSRCARTELIKNVRDKYLLHAAQDKRMDDLCLQALKMIEKMEAAYCGVNCDRAVMCPAFREKDEVNPSKMPNDCPCLLFGTFTEALLRYAAG